MVHRSLDRLPPEALMKMARGIPWGDGHEDYRRILEEWRSEGSMQGMNVEAV
jgi:hypothetical protein